MTKNGQIKTRVVSIEGGEKMKKNKKKKASKAVRTPKKPLCSNTMICGEAILLQTQVFAREFQKRIGRLIDG